jgi:hypothetical protein
MSNSSVGDGELLKDLRDTKSFLMQSSDLSHLLLAKLMAGVAFSLLIWPTSFRKRVLNIISLCSEEQVINSGTPLNVTIVKHLKTVRDGASKQHPSSPVSRPFLAHHVELAIALFTKPLLPKPAGVCFIKSCFKAFSIRFLVGGCSTLTRAESDPFHHRFERLSTVGAQVLIHTSPCYIVNPLYASGI